MGVHGADQKLLSLPTAQAAAGGGNAQQQQKHVLPAYQGPPGGKGDLHYLLELMGTQEAMDAALARVEEEGTFRQRIRIRSIRLLRLMGHPATAKVRFFPRSAGVRGCGTSPMPARAARGPWMDGWERTTELRCVASQKVRRAFVGDRVQVYHDVSVSKLKDGVTKQTIYVVAQVREGGGFGRTGSECDREPDADAALLSQLPSRSGLRLLVSFPGMPAPAPAPALPPSHHTCACVAGAPLCAPPADGRDQRGHV